MARALAVAYPSPALAPVTTQFFPVIFFLLAKIDNIVKPRGYYGRTIFILHLKHPLGHTCNGFLISGLAFFF
jgi:hypothetical protein